MIPGILIPKVESGGKIENNIGGPVKDKFSWQKNFKFSIVFENSSSPDYITEKIVQAFAAQTVPIYFGADNVEGIFNGESFVNCHSFSNFQDVVNYIIWLDQNNEHFIRMLQTPAFINSYYHEEKINGLSSFLYHIIDLPYNEAFRRNRLRQRNMELVYRLYAKFFFKQKHIYKKLRGGE